MTKRLLLTEMVKTQNGQIKSSLPAKNKCCLGEHHLALGTK